MEKADFMAGQLRVRIYPDEYTMGATAARETADRICRLLEEKPQVNVIFAAAPSQIAFLHCLRADPRVDWTRVNAFHMDEYIGLEEDSPQRFGNFLKEHLFSKVPLGSVHYIRGDGPDPLRECARYAGLLEEYPVDIVCLGIGENGHLAFNDPDMANFQDPLSVKVVQLDEVCRGQQVNEGCFPSLDKVPTHAITLTIPALLKARWMYCIVPFAGKAAAVKTALTGDISERCPASILRKKEKSCLYLNAESASLL